ncbi:MAG: hypothetical protein IT531_24915 [Burkholderiales bacterium]|nr:hypothetical protein [Burkholderiales bacterium]
MDILIHFSTQDFNRNLRRYVSRTYSPLERFAPGWREAVGNLNCSDVEIHGRIFEHWRKLLKGIEMETAEAAELISEPNNQPLRCIGSLSPRVTGERWSFGRTSGASGLRLDRRSVVMRALASAEMTKWARVIKLSGATVD